MYLLYTVIFTNAVRNIHDMFDAQYDFTWYVCAMFDLHQSPFYVYEANLFAYIFSLQGECFLVSWIPWIVVS